MRAATVMTDDPELLELVRRSRTGDRGAFDSLSRRLHPWLTSVAQGITHDADAAHDLAQQALLNAYRTLAAYDDAKPFTHWLFAIVRNLSLNHRRQSSRRADDPPRREPTDEPGREAARRETSARLRDSIAALPPDARDVVILRYIEGLPSHAIAARLGMTEVNVRVRLYRALARLKQQLGEVLP